MEEMGKQQREKMLLQAAFEKSLLKKRRDNLPPSVETVVAPQMAHSSALQQKVCSPLARSPKSSSSPAPLHPTSSVSIAREPESNPKPKSWFILAINPGFGSNFRSGWRIRRSAMNEKASVSKELNAKHKKTKYMNGQPKQKASTPSLVYFHIPLPEFSSFTASNFTRVKKEGISSPSINSGFFASMVEAGDVKAAFIGHDHTNYFCGKLSGIQLCYAGGFGYHAHGKARWSRRARVVYVQFEKTVSGEW